MGPAHVFKRFPFAVDDAHFSYAAAAAAAAMLHRPCVKMDHRLEHRLIIGTAK
jgi:hypothetical protein